MFICGVPKDSAEVALILRIEQELFGNLSIPAGISNEIFQIRPELFTSILAPNGEVAAYSTAFPLHQHWARALVAGEVTEPEITPDMLPGYHDPHENPSVYIGSVVIGSQYDPLTKASLLAALLSWRAHQLRDASIRRLSVMMTGVTKQGQQLIRFAGARQLNSGTNRKDGYPIYGRTVTPSFLHRATALVERCLNSRIVQMNATERPKFCAVPMPTMA